MGIFCEITLHKPENGAFTAGNIVRGSIKYAIDEETSFKRITVSLKGKGHLSMETEDKDKQTYRRKEVYVNKSNIVHYKEAEQSPLPIGSYEVEFSFELPEIIPSTLHYLQITPRYVIRCNIAYYIKIKFERFGILNFSKKFEKEITVVSNIIPRLPDVPTICGEQKTLTQWFSKKDRIVYIKATIKNCVLKPGEVIKFDYEVTNDTNVVVKTVETKLMEIYNFKSVGAEATDCKEVKNTESKTSSIKCGETKSVTTEIPIPLNISSLDHSNMVSRNYEVRIIAGLPFPHRDVMLKIPVQIGEINVETSNDDAPPSYWEAMSEDKLSDDF